MDAEKIVACAGPQADCVQFMEYIQKNLALGEFRTGLRLSTAAATSYIRTELATALRKGPYQVNMLIGGHDSKDGASLFFMDYMASSAKVNYAAHGYAAYFVSSTMDANWKPGMKLADAIVLLKKCVHELQTRFLMHMPHFLVKVVDATGVHELGTFSDKEDKLTAEGKAMLAGGAAGGAGSAAGGGGGAEEMKVEKGPATASI